MGKIKKKQTKFQMSDFCDFVPDDPSCQTAPEPEKPEPTSTDGGDAGPKPDGGDKPEDDKDMIWEKFDEMAGEYFHPMEANIAYFTVAAGAVLDIVLHSFVWHEDNASTLSQAASGSGNTDYYDLQHS